MDHVWNSLKEWEEVWKERIEYEKNQPNYEGKEHDIHILKGQLNSIRIAMNEISKWT